MTRPFIYRKANHLTAINPLAALAITGKGKASRIAAFTSLASNAFNAETGKATFLASLQLALGASPSKDQAAFARLETTIGVAAVRMPDNELKGAKDMAARIAMVRDLVTNYQAPSTAVAGKVPALRKGKAGWRSAVQHRIIRNAEDRASKYLAELGAGNAKTESAKNDGKRKGGGNPAPHHGKDGKGKAVAPSHSQLVQPVKPDTPAAFAAGLLGMLASALQYANKNAKAQPMEYNQVTEGLIALHKLALKADGELHVRIAAQDAEAKRKRA